VAEGTSQALPSVPSLADMLGQAFQKCDLYSKVDEVIDVEKSKAYYQKAIDKYFPKTLKW
jgi:hypothetical protein